MAALLMARRTWLTAITLAASIGLLCQGGYIHAKAQLAQYLLQHAWRQTLQDATPHKPWPWADTHPVARLHLPNQQPLVVLAGTSGRTLAFAPGQMASHVTPGHNGPLIIAGHRDTHFAALRDLIIGDIIRVQDQTGVWHRYAIERTTIADARNSWLVPDWDRPTVMLITCYPFAALQAGGPLRYVAQGRYLGEEKTPISSMSVNIGQ